MATTFQEASLIDGTTTFLLYAAGMGSVLAVLSVAVAVAQRRVVTGMKRVLPYVHRASGGLLVVAGAYVAWYGTYELILNSGRDISGGPVATVTDASSRISRLVGEAGAVKIGVAAALVLLVSVLAAATVGRRRHPRGDHGGRPGDGVPEGTGVAGPSTTPVEATR